MPFATSHDGARLYYQDDCLVPPWAPAAPVVLMHHGVALTGDAWAEWLPVLLRAGFRVIRLDMRGFGRSEKVSPDYRWSMDDFFADIEAVAAEAGAQSFHYVGESLGGLIGLALAARRPDLTTSLCLLSTPYDGRLIGPAIDSWRDIVQKQGMAAWSRALMPMRFTPGSVSREIHEWVLGLQAACCPHAVVGQAEFIRTQSMTDELPSVRAPVLILSSDGSPFVDRSLAMDLHERLPSSEIQWYPGHRHSLLISGAARCASAYAHFLDRRLGAD